jgi:hypothetical protein
MGNNFQSGKITLALDQRASHPWMLAAGSLIDAKALATGASPKVTDRPSAAGGGAISLPPSFAAGATSPTPLENALQACS